jgi:hypothetical protein
MERKPFMEQGDVEKCTIIDLKNLNECIVVNKVYVYEPLMKIIEQCDLMIIPPASKDIEICYTKEK